MGPIISKWQGRQQYRHDSPGQKGLGLRRDLHPARVEIFTDRFDADNPQTKTVVSNLRRLEQTKEAKPHSLWVAARRVCLAKIDAHNGISRLACGGADKFGMISIHDRIGSSSSGLGG